MALAFALAALAGTARAQDLRLAFVNSEAILAGYAETRQAMNVFNQDVEEWSQEAEARKREVEKLGNELEAQSLMLSEDKRREKERDYQRKLNEYEQFVQSIWGPEGLVAQRNEELLRPIIGKIQAVLDKIGSEEGYDLIFDAADNNILYADPTYDITEQVLLRLNEGEVEGGE
jgi:outer membrane protein